MKFLLKGSALACLSLGVYICVKEPSILVNVKDIVKYSAINLKNKIEYELM